MRGTDGSLAGRILVRNHYRSLQYKELADAKSLEGVIRPD
jgi:hypothetical protein